MCLARGSRCHVVCVFLETLCLAKECIKNGRTLFSLYSGMWLPEQRGLGPEWWLSALASLAHDRPALLPSELLSGLRGQGARRAQLGRPATQAHGCS